MTSTDFFIILGAIGLIIIAVFSCITMYYLVLVLRRVHGMMDELEEGVKGFASGLRELGRKADALKNATDMAMQGVKTLLALYQRKLERRSKKE